MANKIVKILNHTISDNSPVYLIAEIGINHNSDLTITKKLIDAAFACNWNCVKFQKRTPSICVPEHQKGVMRDTPWGRMTYLDYRYKLEFGQLEYSYIDHYCKEKPIEWSASVWDIPSIDFILNYDVPFLKIPSSKLTEKELLIHAAKTNKLIILSTGMSNYDEIDEAVNILEKHTNGDYILMHTNSTYPTPPQELNLKIIQSLKDRYNCIVGYSGHEYGLEPTVTSVLLGARIIERHITLDHSMWGSDHFASIEVTGMDILCRRIRELETVLGDGVKRLTENELSVRKKLRGH
ncbi:MAG: N-acetylneuraminate synthase family protein [Oligoflexia bacterium]|nr:N-acetylneuraminate synthase family protein [Oligoflexia bacterium]